MSNKQSSVEWLIDQLEDNAWENVSMNQLHLTINMDDYQGKSKKQVNDSMKAVNFAYYIFIIAILMRFLLQLLS